MTLDRRQFLISAAALATVPALPRDISAADSAIPASVRAERQFIR